MRKMHETINRRIALLLFYAHVLRLGVKKPPSFYVEKVGIDRGQAGN